MILKSIYDAHSGFQNFVLGMEGGVSGYVDLLNVMVHAISSILASSFPQSGTYDPASCRPVRHATVAVQSSCN